jgi:hypothetical protein
VPWTSVWLALAEADPADVVEAVVVEAVLLVVEDAFCPDATVLVALVVDVVVVEATVDSPNTLPFCLTCAGTISTAFTRSCVVTTLK